MFDSFVMSDSFVVSDSFPRRSEAYGPTDHIRCWVGFLFVSLASQVLAPAVTRFGFPKLTGYLIVGALSGPYILKLVSKEDVASLKYINTFALAYITTSAGAEMHIEELKALIKPIVAQTFAIMCVVFAVVTLVCKTLANTALSQFTNEMTDTQQWAVGLILGVLALTGSPAASVAVLREMRCKGTFTTTFMGCMVLSDIGVIIATPLCLSYARSQFTGTEFQPKTAGIVIATIVASILLGGLVGLTYMILMKFRRFVFHVFVFPVGFLIFLGCQYLAAMFKRTIADTTVTVAIEPLLLCIVGGFLTVNFSKYRHRFVEALGLGGPHIFLPFFTLVGASLNLEVFITALPFAIILAIVRAFCIFLASSSTGYLVGQKKFTNLTLWMTQVSQAGFSLGLAASIGYEFPGWGENLSAVIVSCVVVNLLWGPVLCKRAIIWSGEGNKASGTEAQEEAENDPNDVHTADLNKAVIIGVTRQSKALALSLLKLRWGVTVLTKSVEEAIAFESEVAEWAEDERAEILSHAAPAEREEEAAAPALLLRFEDNLKTIPVTMDAAAMARTCQHPFEAGPETILKDLVPANTFTRVPSKASASAPHPDARSFVEAAAVYEVPGAEAQAAPAREPLALRKSNSSESLLPAEISAALQEALDEDADAPAPEHPPATPFALLAAQSFVDKCDGVFDVLADTEALKTVVLALDSDLASLALLDSIQYRWGDKTSSAVRFLVLVKDLTWSESIAMLNGVALNEFVSSNALARVAATTPFDRDGVVVQGRPTQDEWSSEYLQLYEGNALYACTEQGKALRNVEDLEIPSAALAPVLSVVKARMEERGRGGRMMSRIDRWLQRAVGAGEGEAEPGQAPRLLQVDLEAGGGGQVDARSDGRSTPEARERAGQGRALGVTEPAESLSPGKAKHVL